MKTALSILAVAGLASAAAASPAVSSFTGGTAFPAFHGGSTGDAIGYRFSVNSNIVLNNVGMYNGTAGGNDGVVDSTHEWGLWNSGGILLASGIIDPNAGFQDGDWFYSDVNSNVALSTGEQYTLAVVYAIDDNDSYLSSVTSITSAAEVNIEVAVFPDVGDLGLTFPGSDSPGNPGRLGPNFTFVPAPGAVALAGFAGLAVSRRRR